MVMSKEDMGRIVMIICRDKNGARFQQKSVRENHSYSYITFRMDDICPQMNHEKFLRFKDIFCRYNIKPILGVIPDNQDETLNCDEESDGFWTMIKELKIAGWSIAQHGHTHVYTTDESGIFSLFNFSEFAGVPYEEQLLKIRKGKETLNRHAIEPNIFMAPGHSLDKNTLKALASCDFQYITDGRSKRPYIYQGLKFIPCRDHVFRKKSGLVTICIHSNTVSEATFQELEAFIRQNRESIIDFTDAITLPTMNYKQARIEEWINIIFLKYIKPRLYPIYSPVKRLLKKRK